MLNLALPLATACAPFLAAACGSRGTGPPHSELPSAPHPADLVRVGHRWAPSITQRRRLPSYHNQLNDEGTELTDEQLCTPVCQRYWLSILAPNLKKLSAEDRREVRTLVTAMDKGAVGGKSKSKGGCWSGKSKGKGWHAEPGWQSGQSRN